jgi:hypothetical protein
MSSLWETSGKVTGAAPSPVAAQSQTSGDDVPMMGIKLIKEFEGCHLKAYPDPLTGNFQSLLVGDQLVRRMVQRSRWVIQSLKQKQMNY